MADVKITTGSGGASPAKVRLTWFDACRVFGAVFVVLIHSTTDFRGQPFSEASRAERVFPAMVRGISEFSSSELFLIFSLFLLAWRLERRAPSYRENIVSQAERLLVPFSFWVVFYAFFRLFKADVFGYGDVIREQLLQPMTWLGYFVLGSAQYHLHFIPELMLIILFYPWMRGATSYPILGLLIIPCLYVMDAVQDYNWSKFSDPVLRDYVMRVIKDFCYVGYGFSAFALYGIWKRGLDHAQSRNVFYAALYTSLILILATTNYIVAVVETGHWVNRPPASFFGHALLPVTVFALFMSLQYRNWNPRLSTLAKFTFGVYLVHPIGIDLYDVTLQASGLDVPPWFMIISKWLLALPFAFGLSYLLSLNSATSWMIGLGDFPLKGWRSSSSSSSLD